MDRRWASFKASYRGRRLAFALCGAGLAAAAVFAVDREAAQPEGAVAQASQDAFSRSSGYVMALRSASFSGTATVVVVKLTHEGAEKEPVSWALSADHIRPLGSFGRGTVAVRQGVDGDLELRLPPLASDDAGDATIHITELRVEAARGAPSVVAGDWELRLDLPSSHDLVRALAIREQTLAFHLPDGRALDATVIHSGTELVVRYSVPQDLVEIAQPAIVGEDKMHVPMNLLGPPALRESVIARAMLPKGPLELTLGVFDAFVVDVGISLLEIDVGGDAVERIDVDRPLGTWLVRQVVVDRAGATLTVHLDGSLDVDRVKFMVHDQAGRSLAVLEARTHYSKSQDGSVHEGTTSVTYGLGAGDLAGIRLSVEMATRVVSTETLGIEP